MKRRNFLLIIGQALLSFGFASCLKKPEPSTLSESLAETILSELHYLKHAKSDVLKFAAAFLQKKSNRTQVKRYFSNRAKRPESTSARDEEFLRSYLLSSTFFSNEMDETQTIRFVALYDPYTSPCSNPFIRS